MSGTIAECNAAYLSLVGESLMEAGRTPLFAPLRPDHPFEITGLFGPLRQRAAVSTHVDVVLVRDDGSPIRCQATATLVCTLGDNAELCAVTVQDITERHMRELRLQHEATHDALTGITNRAYLLAQLQRRLEQRQDRPRFAILFIDVDDFKTVNDTLGHAAGDACLQAMAQRLRALMRADDVVSRYGGDEFAVLFCDGASIDKVDDIAVRVRRELREPIAFGEVRLVVSASLGVALDDGISGDAEAVLASADRAMYLDKGRAESRAVLIHRPAA